VEKDTNFAFAYALMADCYYLQIYYAYDPAPGTVDKARAAADRALLLDDSLAEAHVARAMVQSLEQQLHPTMESVRRAVELNPNLAIAHLRYAWCLCGLGQLNDAVREMKRAQELDPLSATNSTALGILLTFARQFAGALTYCSRAAELDPDNYLVRCNLAIAYWLNGMFQQAIDQYRMAGELSPDHKGDVLASVATLLTSAGRKSEADSMVPGILELAMAGKADPYNVAVLCAARGDKEQALKWLAKAVVNRQLVCATLRYDPQFDLLRLGHRFSALLQQQELPRAWRTKAISRGSRGIVWLARRGERNGIADPTSARRVMPPGIRASCGTRQAGSPSRLTSTGLLSSISFRSGTSRLSPLILAADSSCRGSRKFPSRAASPLDARAVGFPKFRPAVRNQFSFREFFGLARKG